MSRRLLTGPATTLALALLGLGIALGLFVPAALRGSQVSQADYLTMVAWAYEKDRDAVLATERLGAAGIAPDVGNLSKLSREYAGREDSDLEAVARLRRLIRDVAEPGDSRPGLPAPAMAAVSLAVLGVGVLAGLATPGRTGSALARQGDHARKGSS